MFFGGGYAFIIGTVERVNRKWRESRMEGVAESNCMLQLCGMRLNQYATRANFDNVHKCKSEAVP